MCECELIYTDLIAIILFKARAYAKCIPYITANLHNKRCTVSDLLTGNRLRVLQIYLYKDSKDKEIA